MHRWCTIVMEKVFQLTSTKICRPCELDPALSSRATLHCLHPGIFKFNLWGHRCSRRISAISYCSHSTTKTNFRTILGSNQHVLEEYLSMFIPSGIWSSLFTWSATVPCHVDVSTPILTRAYTMFPVNSTGQSKILSDVDMEHHYFHR